MTDIEEFARERTIPWLVHFTRLENIASILKEGLIPRSDLLKRGADFLVNDEFRYDHCESANCLSIGFPNYKMFYSLRKQNEGVKWVVLGIKLDVLWSKQCAFCYQNAASSTQTNIPISERRTVSAFKNLYDPDPNKPNREELGLELWMPTNPQAEILVFDLIEPEYIFGLAVNDPVHEQELKQLFPDIKISFVPNLFSYRPDFDHWR